ncbi:AAC(3) family N-acetyltransferase [Neptuniibacter sp. SY11_33]|uniref:AAC(3) family N-acetyltransferase n=1 Tax=Neptuniibacter sp. SY11_33 TaxID=3398215 RepID=UPI0039F511F0
MRGITKEKIIKQLKELGVKEGDTLFVAADLMRVGYFNSNADQTLKDWVEIFDVLLGEKGTIVVPTYSPSYLRFVQKYDFVFTADTPSNSGSLAKAYLNFCPGAIRGKHPTNSCTSNGFHSQVISAFDGPEYPKYMPYEKVVELGGKNLMLGIVDERNSPFTYHHVQEKLGHTTSHPFSGLLETTYIDENGKKKKYIQRQLGGCTGGVHKAWGYHLAKNAVKFGQVGRSVSALVNAQKSTEILTKLMKETPHLMKCDNRSCISCYGRYRYNGIGAVWFYFREVPNLIKKLIRKLL